MCNRLLLLLLQQQTQMSRGNGNSGNRRQVQQLLAQQQWTTTTVALLLQAAAGSSNMSRWLLCSILICATFCATKRLLTIARCGDESPIVVAAAAAGGAATVAAAGAIWLLWLRHFLFTVPRIVSRTVNCFFFGGFWRGISQRNLIVLFANLAFIAHNLNTIELGTAIRKVIRLICASA